MFLFIFSVIFCYLLSSISTQNTTRTDPNNINLSIFQPDPSEIDPIWEATIRNVMFNTTEFKPSKLKVVVKSNIIEEDDEGESDMSGEEDAPSVTKVQVSSENPSILSEPETKTLKKETNSDSFDTSDDERKQQREKALRSWLEASLAELSKKSKISKSESQKEPLAPWTRLSELLTSEIASLARAVTPTITESLYSANVSSDCSRDFLRLVFGIQNSQDWAWRILDANGRLPSGLISGSSFAFGDYDQCLESDSSASNSMISRYCLLHFSIPVPGSQLRMHFKEHPSRLYYLLEQNQDTGFDSSMRKYLKRLYQAMYSTSILNGICVPATCSGEDVKNFILSFDAFKNQSTTLAAEISVTDCTLVPATTPIDAQTLLQRFDSLIESLSLHERIALLTAVALFIVPSIGWLIKQCLLCYTAAEVPYESLLEHFSPVNNFRRLILITDQQRNSKTQFLSVLRILSTFWIIVTHCAILGSYFAPSIVYRFEAEARNFAFSAVGQLFYNGYASVEIFFFLSGFLLIRNITNRTKIPSFADYVFYRFVRLIPAVIGLLAFFFLWPYIGSGPVFQHYNRKLIDACERNWWKTLLLVNNYDKSDDICLVHTWFLSADFQLHILAYPVLIAVRKGRLRSARLMIFLLVGFSLLWSVMKLNSRRIPASLNALFQLVPQEFYRDMQALYYPTQNHFTSYFLGIATAYYLHQKRKFAYKSHILLLVPMAGFLSIFFPLYWTRENGPSDVESRIGFIYFILQRAIHPISIACLCLWALPRTSKFSSPSMTIASRLTFAIYLVHLPIIWHFLFTTRQPIRLEFLSILFFSGGILFFTLPIALAFHLLVEAPYSSLCSELFLKLERSKNPPLQQPPSRQRDSPYPEALRISQLSFYATEPAGNSVDYPERHKSRLWQNIELNESFAQSDPALAQNAQNAKNPLRRTTRL